MSRKKQKNKTSSKDPWDAPVKGTRDQGDAESETVRIPVDIVDDIIETSSAEPPVGGPSRADSGRDAPPPDEPVPDPVPVPPDPRDLHIADLEARLEGTESLLEQTRAAYRKREKELVAVRERLERDQEKHLLRNRIALMERLFEPMDNLDRSLSSAADWPDKDERTEGLLGGLAMVRRQLRERLEELGLVRLDPMGDLFDPNIHEAINTVPVKDKKMDGKVIQVWEPGYRCGDVVIRAAKVVVGRKG